MLHRNFRKYSVYGILAGILLFTGCSSQGCYYMSNLHPVPLYNESNKFYSHLSGSTGMIDCFEAAAGYSFPKNLAVTAAFMSGGKEKAPNENYMKIRYFEGAGGYYKPLKKTGVVEIFAGYARGSLYHNYTKFDMIREVNDGNSDLSFSKFFIQPDIGIRNSRLEFAFSWRISYVIFDHIKYTTTGHLDEVNQLRADPSHLITEPALTLRAGFRNVKIQLQATRTGSQILDNFIYDPLRISMGLNFSFPDSRKERD